MTTYNKKKSILEKGGMMIEALAMLGLIAVVTPTMYKKSAERTLEVEDINTATKIRTYMNAVEAMLSTNYTNIINSMQDGNQTQKTYQLSDLRAFLPYGYASTNALYDYGDPAISVVRDGNNLTGFLLFPANEDAENGIGRERTARIASLVGANGGYVRASKDARGVGGVWALKGTTYDKVFPSSGGAKVNSIVVSTANPVTGVAQGEMDNDKYLQRTYESDDDIWRNTMRTDLYLGGYNEGDTHDDYGNQGDLHSIRNVNSMIIGAEDGEGDNGLYIADTATNKNAYIAGTLKAVAEKFVVDDDKLSYGQDTTKDYFKVTSTGDLTQYGNVHLAEGFMASSNTAVKIGGDSGTYVLDAVHDGFSTSVRLLQDNYFSVTKNNDGGFLEMMAGVYNKLKNGGSETALAEPDYTTTQTYPVWIGSNTRVNGLLTANQVDTNTLRSTSLKTGSDKVDDANKWLDVDSGGIKMYSTDRAQIEGSGTYASKVAVGVDTDGLQVRAGGLKDDDLNAAVLKVQNTDNSQANSQIRASATSVRLKANSDDGDVTMMNDNLAQVLKEDEIVIGSRATFSDMGFAEDSVSDYRVVFGKNGNVDLIDSNLHISKTEGDKTYNILSVGATKKVEGFGDRIYDSFSDASVDGAYAAYDMAVHGNAVFTSQQENKENNAGFEYLSIGKASSKAGVSIAVDGTPNYDNDGDRQVLFIDLKGYGRNNTIYEDDPVLGNSLSYPGTDDKPVLTTGAVYIRKGMVDVMPEKPYSNEGGKGASNATNGYGMIKASRFVANNVDKDGNYVKVDKILKDNTYTDYNGSDHQQRYDTYMVNPAYTSVMHDIKLTTRGGARLSDVLPDFITKGIYVATNDYDDNLTNFTFSLADRDNGRVTSMMDVKVGGQPPSRGSLSWASPYAGSVPAPQCPPGYSRVITANPTSMSMAEAGRLVNAGRSDPSTSANWFVDDELMASVGRDKYREGNQDEINKLTPQYKTMSVNINPGSAHALNEGYSEGDGYLYVRNMTPGGFRVVRSDSYSDNAYALTADKEGGFNPLLFQQNTWLKTLAVPVCAGGTETKVGNDESCPGYTRGWAVLLGFVYPSYLYEAYIDGENGKKFMSSTNKTLLWNVFPVAQSTLEATVSTYCYFNRANLEKLGAPFVANEEVQYYKYVDPYHPVRSSVPLDYEKEAGDAYLKRLNDPTLKYNEVW